MRTASPNGAKNARKELVITDVPEQIKTALVADARNLDVSVNELAVSILADHYRVKRVQLNGTARESDPSKPTLSIRGGAKLHRKIAVDAARRGGTLRGVVLERIALHYGLEPEPIGRRPRQKEESR